MVYCGKPSLACKNCKRRRIKCDQVRPHCSQCRRIDLDCPGYPEKSDLIFRDETVATRIRSLKGTAVGNANRYARLPSQVSLVGNQNHNQSQQQPKRIELQSYVGAPPGVAPGISGGIPGGFGLLLHRDSEDDEEEKPTYQSPPEVHYALSFSIDDQAVAYFFKNFIPGNSNIQTIKDGLFHYLPAIHLKASANSPVSLATKSLALFLMSANPSRWMYIEKSVRTYTLALRSISEALHDPEDARSDGLLMAVLLCSFYEVFKHYWRDMQDANQDVLLRAQNSPGTIETRMNGYTNHTIGAIHLVKLRGPGQLLSECGAALFRAARWAVTLNSIFGSGGLPDFSEPYHWCPEDPLDRSPCFTLARLSMRLPEIHSRAQRLFADYKSESNREEVHNLMQDAALLDSEYETWYQNLPETWRYMEVPVDSDKDPRELSTEIYDGMVHVYNDQHLSSIINNHRANRLLCIAVLIGCLSYLATDGQDYKADSRYHYLKEKTKRLCDEICASVPAHLTWQLERRAAELGLHPEAVHGAGAYLLIWPLFIAASAEGIPARQRVWIHGRLGYVTHSSGMDQEMLYKAAREKSPPISRLVPDYYQSLAGY